MASRSTDVGMPRPAGSLRARLELLARPRQPEALPVAFDRRRIYILPTAFGAFFFVLLCTMGIGALNYNNNPALLLVLLLGGAANTSLIAAHLQLSGLRIVAVEAEPVPAGAPLRLRLHARAAPGRERRGLQVAHGMSARVLQDGRGGGNGRPHPRVLPNGRIESPTPDPVGWPALWSYVWSSDPASVPVPEAMARRPRGGRCAGTQANRGRT